MKYNNLIVSLAAVLLLAASPAKAQTNEHSNERHNQIFDFDEKMEGEYIGTYTNEAGCRDQLVITLKLKE